VGLEACKKETRHVQAYCGLPGKLQGQRPHLGSGYRWRDIIQTDLCEICCDDVNWVETEEEWI
jgi:hypothetical protein